MTISLQQAKQLCTAKEFEQFENSLPPKIEGFTVGGLRNEIQRARRARDKYRDLEQRQAAEAKGTRSPSGARPAQGHQGTTSKVQLFQETLDRLEARLQELEQRTPS